MNEHKKYYDIYLPISFIEKTIIDTDKEYSSTHYNKSKMIFIESSDSYAFFIRDGINILNNCNDALKNHHACPFNSSIKRIILTNELVNNKITVIEPFYDYKFKYQPVKIYIVKN